MKVERADGANQVAGRGKGAHLRQAARAVGTIHIPFPQRPKYFRSGGWDGARLTDESHNPSAKVARFETLLIVLQSLF